MRHIKFASLREMERPFVRRYIQAAMEQVPSAAGVRGNGQSVVKSSLSASKPKKRSNVVRSDRQQT